MGAMSQAGQNTNPGQIDAGRGVDSVDFTDQFRSSFRVLWRIAVGIVGDHASADDVLQEAAIVAYGKREKFRPGTNFTAWMGQTVRYVALNHARKEHKHRSRSSDPEIVEKTVSNPRHDAPRYADPGAAGQKRQAFDAKVQQALSEVNEIARACLLLRTLDNLEYSQISELLDIPEGTAMSHVHRTRKLLREKLAHLDPNPATEKT